MEQVSLSRTKSGLTQAASVLPGAVSAKPEFSSPRFSWARGSPHPHNHPSSQLFHSIQLRCPRLRTSLTSRAAQAPMSPAPPVPQGPQTALPTPSKVLWLLTAQRLPFCGMGCAQSNYLCPPGLVARALARLRPPF